MMIRGGNYTDPNTASILLSGGYGDNGYVKEWLLSSVASGGGGAINNDLKFRYVAGGSATQYEALKLRYNGEVIVNDEGWGTHDFRVESDSNTHAIYLDAGAYSGAGAIGFGVSSPQQHVHQANDTGRRLGNITEWAGNLADIANGATRTITLTGLGNYSSAMVELWVAWRLNGGNEPATSRILITFYEGNNSITDITVLEFSGKNIVQSDWTTTTGSDFITFEITNTSWTSTSSYVAGTYYVKAFNSPAAATLTVG